MLLIRLLLLLLNIFAVSCQTWTLDKNVVMDSHLEKRFQQCSSKQGGGRFSFLKDEKLKLKAEVEWMIEKNCDFMVAVVDPLGSTIIELEKEGQDLFLQSKASWGQQKAGVDTEGYVHFQGRRLGIKAKEISCLLSGDIPVEWRELIFAMKVNPSQKDYFLVDGIRDIKLSFYSDERGHLSKQCVLWEWNLFWIFSRAKIQFCQEFEPRFKKNLEITGGYKIIVIED